MLPLKLLNFSMGEQSNSLTMLYTSTLGVTTTENEFQCLHIVKDNCLITITLKISYFSIYLVYTGF